MTSNDSCDGGSKTFTVNTPTDNVVDNIMDTRPPYEPYHGNILFSSQCSNAGVIIERKSYYQSGT